MLIYVLKVFCYFSLYIRMVYVSGVLKLVLFGCFAYMYVCTACITDACGSQKRASDPLEL